MKTFKGCEFAIFEFSTIHEQNRMRTTKVRIELATRQTIIALRFAQQHR